MWPGAPRAAPPVAVALPCLPALFAVGKVAAPWSGWPGTTRSGSYNHWGTGPWQSPKRSVTAPCLPTPALGGGVHMTGFPVSRGRFTDGGSSCAGDRGTSLGHNEFVTLPDDPVGEFAVPREDERPLVHPP